MSARAPRRPDPLSASVAAALAVAVLAAPGAARSSEDCGAHADPASHPPAQPVADAPAPTVTRAIDADIDWGSAGAGVAAGALLLTAAGASAVTHR